MGYTLQDALADTGTMFLVSVMGGVAATIFTQRGSLSLYAFSIFVLVMATPFVLIMERTRTNTPIFRGKPDYSPDPPAQKRVQRPQSSKPSFRYDE